MPIRFVALETVLVRRLQAGGADANGQVPERRVAQADGLPCRHCLAMINKGEDFLTLAHRPFPALQPYAELGPIFLHASACERGGGSDRIPAFLDSPLLRYFLDVHAARAHYANNPDKPGRNLGAVLLGLKSTDFFL